MLRKFGFFVIVATLAMTAPAARAALPPGVQSDLLTTKLATALQEERYADALTLIGELRALKVQLPDSISYFEALASARTGDWIKAHEQLTGYLSKVGKSGKLYQQALTLYAEVEPKVAEARKKALAEAESQMNMLIKYDKFSSARERLKFHAEGGRFDAAAVATWKRRIDEAETAAAESARQEAARQQREQAKANRKKQRFDERIAGHDAFFRSELNYRFNNQSVWKSDVSSMYNGGTWIIENRLAGNIKTTWPTRGDKCAIYIKIDNSKYSIERGYNSFRSRNRTNKGSGTVYPHRIWASLVADDFIKLHFLRSASYKPQYLASGSIPSNLRRIRISHPEKREQGSYRGQSKKYSKDREPDYKKDKTKDYDDPSIEIFGTVEQLKRFKTAYERLGHICDCREGDTYDGGKYCNSLPSTPPYTPGPKVTYSAPKPPKASAPASSGDSSDSVN